MTDHDPLAPRKGLGANHVLIGCLGIIGIILVILVGLGAYTYFNWRSWVGGAATEALNEALAESDISAEQQSAIRAEVEPFIDAFKNGDVTLQELQDVGEELLEGPVLPMIAVYGLDRGYIASSSLPDSEKQDARLQFRRVARGVADKGIPYNDLNNILDPLEPDPGERQGSKIDTPNFTITLAKPEHVDEDELREAVENARSAADAANVPPEDFEIDYAQEIRAAIERALGRSLPRDGP